MASAAQSAGLVAFINQLEGHQLEALFTQPYATVALLRSLQPLARQVLARLVCTGGAISSGKLGSFLVAGCLACCEAWTTSPSAWLAPAVYGSGPCRVGGALQCSLLPRRLLAPRLGPCPTPSPTPTPPPPLASCSPGDELCEARGEQQAGSSTFRAYIPAPAVQGSTGWAARVHAAPQLPGTAAPRYVLRVGGPSMPRGLPGSSNWPGPWAAGCPVLMHRISCTCVASPPESTLSSSRPSMPRWCALSACSRSMVDDSQLTALAPPHAAPPSATELAAAARRQWEALLLHLVDGASSPPSPPRVLHAVPLDVPGLLAAAGLMQKNEYTQRQSECSRRGIRMPGCGGWGGRQSRA